MKIIFYNFIFLVLILLFIDNLIFYFPQLFSQNIIKLTTQRTQIAYLLNTKNNSTVASRKHDDVTNRVFDEYIFYHQNTKHSKERIYDDFGYRNPDGIIKNSPEIIILGDSFAENIAFSNYLRKNINLKSYSMGVSGQGIFHWYYHLKRYYESEYFKDHPKLIILNYYEGNDIVDSLRAERITNSGYTNSIYYPTHPMYDLDDVFRQYSFFNEINYILKNIIINNFSWSMLNISINQNISDHNSDNLRNDECKIFYDPYEVNTKNYFDPKKLYSQKIIKQINKIFEIVEKDKTKILFTYIPNTRTIYSDSKKIYNDYKFSSNNFKNFFSKDFIFFDSTDKLIKKSKDENIHKCNVQDIHFSEKGYKFYANLLSLKIKEILD